MEHVLSTHLFANHRLTSVWLDHISRAGIPQIEIFCARQHFDYRDRAQVNELSYWFRDMELKVHSVHSPMYSDEYWGRTGPTSVINITELSKPKRLECVDEIKRALEVAERIPFQYLVQHLGVAGEEFDEFKLDAAFSALEDIRLFAANRGVEVLLENIPNALSSAERLIHFLEITHLDLNVCLDLGHAHMHEGIDTAFNILQHRIRSTHIHDNNGRDDNHLFPFLSEGGTIDWKRAVDLLRSRAGQYPMLLELRETPGIRNSLAAVGDVFERLENL